MEFKIFYSWQTDLPNSTNRGFIQSALEMAAKAIRDDESIKIEPVIDRDTVGVPGSPDIADTIFSKIEKSQIFVADVSIINYQDKSRKTPNPNVLLELGYAMNSISLDRIIIVMNTAYGKPELLPFDLRMKRVVTYEIKEDEKERSDQRRKLASIFESGIRTIVSNFEEKTSTNQQSISIYDQAIQAILNAQKNQVFLRERFLSSRISLKNDQIQANLPD